MLEFLTLFANSFLAATILPIGSEVLFTWMIVEKYSVVISLMVATLGNTLGGMVNFWIGKLGKLDWCERYLKIDAENIHRWQHHVQGKSSLLAFLTWVPFIGDPMAVALGFFRAPMIKVVLFMTLGKFLRYLTLALMVEG